MPWPWQKKREEPKREAILMISIGEVYIKEVYVKAQRKEQDRTKPVKREAKTAASSGS